MFIINDQIVVILLVNLPIQTVCLNCSIDNQCLEKIYEEFVISEEPIKLFLNSAKTPSHFYHEGGPFYLNSSLVRDLKNEIPAKELAHLNIYKFKHSWIFAYHLKIFIAHNQGVLISKDCQFSVADSLSVALHVHKDEKREKLMVIYFNSGVRMFYSESANLCSNNRENFIQQSILITRKVCEPKRLFVNGEYIYVLLDCEESIYLTRLGFDELKDLPLLPMLKLKCPDAKKRINAVAVANYNIHLEGYLFICQEINVCKYNWGNILKIFETSDSNNRDMIVYGEITEKLESVASEIQIIIFESKNFLAWRSVLIKSIGSNDSSLLDFDQRPGIPKVEYELLKINYNARIDRCSFKITLQNGTKYNLIECKRLYGFQCLAYAKAFRCKLCESENSDSRSSDRKRICVSYNVYCSQIPPIGSLSLGDKRVFIENGPFNFHVPFPFLPEDEWNLILRNSYCEVGCKPEPGDKFSRWNRCITFRIRECLYKTDFMLEMNITLYLSCAPPLRILRSLEKSLEILDPEIESIIPEHKIFNHSGFFTLTLKNDLKNHTKFVGIGSSQGMEYETRNTDSSKWIFFLPKKIIGNASLFVHSRPFKVLPIKIVKTPIISKPITLATFKERNVLITVDGKDLSLFFQPSLDMPSKNKDYQTKLFPCNVTSDISMKCLTPKITGNVSLGQHYLVIMTHNVVFDAPYNLSVIIRDTPVIVSSNYKTDKKELVTVIKDFSGFYQVEVKLFNDYLYDSAKCMDHRISSDGMFNCISDKLLDTAPDWNVKFIFDNNHVMTFGPILFNGLAVRRLFMRKLAAIIALVFFILTVIVIVISLLIGFNGWFNTATEGSMGRDATTVTTRTQARPETGHSFVKTTSTASTLELSVDKTLVDPVKQTTLPNSSVPQKMLPRGTFVGKTPLNVDNFTVKMLSTETKLKAQSKKTGKSSVNRKKIEVKIKITKKTSK